MKQFRLFSKKLLFTNVLLFCFLSHNVFAQSKDSAPEDLFGVPDTIVFVSDEDIIYSEEYLMIHFYAVDEESRFPVPASFKIHNKNNNKLLSGAPEDKHQYQASLVSNEEYLIEVYAPGYVNYSEIFSLRANKEKKDLHKIIPLEKSNFITTLKAINEVTGDVVNNASITLINITSNKTIHTLINPNTGTCRADFDLNSEYKVEVNAIGYFPYYEDYVTVEKLTSKDFVLTPTRAVSHIKINAVDVFTNNPVNPKIIILDNAQKELPLKWKKDYAEANVYSGVMYQIKAEAEGYEVYKEKLFVESAQDIITIKLIAKSVEKDKPEEIALEIDQATDEDIVNTPVFENLEIGKSVILNNIIFEQSKYELKEASYEELDKLANTLHKNPEYRIIIAGHTDNRGDKRLNQLLSKNRAKVIENYLIEKGIEEKRLEVIGHGSSHPLAPNDSEENRMKNRRVEFIIK